MAGIDELLKIMARLRDPEQGCPWDLDQDFASISPHTIEEAYEVDEAIARGDLEALCDELGDLLFQVVFQSRLGEEQGAFDFDRVVEGVCAKLVRRHPHIFADAPSPGSAASQVANWEAIKAAERAEKAATHPASTDPFEGIPRALPALTRSAKLAGRLARLRAVVAPGAESEADRLQSPEAVAAALGLVAGTAARATTSSVTSSATQPLARSERLQIVGEGIRAWVELARQLGVDPEQALRLEDDRATDAARRDLDQAARGRHR